MVLVRNCQRELRWPKFLCAEKTASTEGLSAVHREERPFERSFWQKKFGLNWQTRWKPGINRIWILKSKIERLPNGVWITSNVDEIRQSGLPAQPVRVSELFWRAIFLRNNRKAPGIANIVPNENVLLRCIVLRTRLFAIKKTGDILQFFRPKWASSLIRSERSSMRTVHWIPLSGCVQETSLAVLVRSGYARRIFCLAFFSYSESKLW